MVVVFAIGLLAAVGLLLHSLRYPTFFFDDAFISLRYADRFRHGQGLTWTDGERVEGYSNFLWTVVLGVVGLVSEGLLIPARALGFLCTSLAAAAMAYSLRPTTPGQIVSAALPAAALVVLGPVGAWTGGGLEHPMYIAALTWGIALLQPAAQGLAMTRARCIVAGLVLTAVCLTRPDGVMMAGAVCLGAWLPQWRKARARRDVGMAAAIALSGALAHLLFRRSYYGAWLPNTSSKLDTDLPRVMHGLWYVSHDLPLWKGLVGAAALALVIALFSRKLRARVWPIVLPLVAWCVYVAIIGGDFMPQRRHLIPALALLCMLAGEACALAVRFSRPTRAMAWLGAPLLVVSLWKAQDGDPAIADANITRWYWEAVPVARLFRIAFGHKDPLVAVDAAGALPYFSGLRSLDMLGLNDAWLAHNPPQWRSTVGHDLGNGNYVLGRRPDLIVFRYPAGDTDAAWIGGLQMKGNPEFGWKYQRVFYLTDGPEPVRGVVYVRREDGRLGVERHNCEIRVPGYLLAGTDRTRAELVDGRLGTPATREEPAVLTDLVIPGGVWIVDVSANGPVDVLASVKSEEAAGFQRVVIEVPKPRWRVTVAVRPSDDDKRVMVWRVRFRKSIDGFEPTRGQENGCTD